jgi:hypothetical protein
MPSTSKAMNVTGFARAAAVGSLDRVLDIGRSKEGATGAGSRQTSPPSSKTLAIPAGGQSPAR